MKRVTKATAKNKADQKRAGLTVAESAGGGLVVQIGERMTRQLKGLALWHEDSLEAVIEAAFKSVCLDVEADAAEVISQATDCHTTFGELTRNADTAALEQARRTLGLMYA
jgi:hypothetical protein